jgi:hypothetical protein
MQKLAKKEKMDADDFKKEQTLQIDQKEREKLTLD